MVGVFSVTNTAPPYSTRGHCKKKGSNIKIDRRKLNPDGSRSMAKPVSSNPESGLSIGRCAAFSSQRTNQPSTACADATKKPSHGLRGSASGAERHILSVLRQHLHSCSSTGRRQRIGRQRRVLRSRTRSCEL
jgi:hypothetical protein